MIAANCVRSFLLLIAHACSEPLWLLLGMKPSVYTCRDCKIVCVSVRASQVLEIVVEIVVIDLAPRTQRVDSVLQLVVDGLVGGHVMA